MAGGALIERAVCSTVGHRQRRGQGGEGKKGHVCGVPAVLQPPGNESSRPRSLDDPHSTPEGKPLTRSGEVKKRND